LKAKKRIVFRSVGVGLVVGGISALVILLRNAVRLSAIWSRAVAAGQSTIVWANAAMVVVFSVLMLVSIAGGIQMLRGRPSGYWLGLVGVVPQLLSVVTSGFQYRCAMFGFLAVGVAGANEKVRVGMFSESGTQLVVGFDPVPWWAIQLNLAALVAVVLMIGFRRIPESKVAVEGDSPATG
jgi:hypothetical protein